MRASALEFRLRILIQFVIIVLGFVAPWNYLLHLDSGKSLWLPAALYLERAGVLNLIAASNALLILGIVFAFTAALLRTWATAWLGAPIALDHAMHGQQVVADGPYRHMQHPLYLGTWLHTVALALLMPPSGALFAILAIGFEQLRLISAEEAFLTLRLGQPYQAYSALVPRIVPSLRPRVPGSGERKSWVSAFGSEIYMWGVVIAFATVGWRYNASLVVQGIVIAFGISLIARGFLPGRPSEIEG